MNILVIGNGFDLAHGLPTMYKDFLDFTRIFSYYYKRNKEQTFMFTDKYKRFEQYILNLFSGFNTENLLVVQLMSLIENNILLKHFIKIYESREMKGKSGWIDFESEISNVVQKLDSTNFDENKFIRLDFFEDIIMPLHYAEYDRNITFDVYKIKTYCLEDLDRLIRCLEIYLTHFIGNIEIENKLSDIKKLPYIHKILSFNYTNTYEKLYKNNSQIEINYIHGKAELENDIDSCNMVLGIDEYLDNNKKNIELEYIGFKKYYQRGEKNTENAYRNWIDIIKADDIKKSKRLNIIKSKYVHNLFIFGHSLDKTDKDVLCNLILNNNVQTTIFYLDKNDYGKKIKNLIKIIGKDEYVKRTGGASKTITFKEIQNKKTNIP